MLIKRLISNILGLVIRILAFVTILSMIILAVNKILVIVADEHFVQIMSIIVNYAGIALIILVALRSALKLPFIFGIPYMVLIAGVVVLSFFQPTFDAIMQTFLPKPVA